MASTGKRRRKKASRPKKRIPRKPAPKKKVRAAKRAKPVPARTRTRTRTRGKPKPSKKRSIAAKKGWATRRAAAERERIEWLRGDEMGTGDAEVIDADGAPVDPEYEPYPVPEIDGDDDDDWIEDARSYVVSDDEDDETDFMSYHENFAAELRELGDHAMDVRDEIEWYPRFDEVYDYIDALVEEYDLDAHDLFELAFGYTGDEAA